MTMTDIDTIAKALKGAYSDEALYQSIAGDSGNLGAYHRGGAGQITLHTGNIAKKAGIGEYIPSWRQKEQSPEERLTDLTDQTLVHEITHRAMLPTVFEEKALIGQRPELFDLEGKLEGDYSSLARAVEMPIVSPLNRGMNEFGQILKPGYNFAEAEQTEGFSFRPDAYLDTPEEVIARAMSFHRYLQKQQGDKYVMNAPLTMKDLMDAPTEDTLKFTGLTDTTGEPATGYTDETGLRQWDFDNKEQFLKVANAAGLSKGFVPNFIREGIKTSDLKEKTFLGGSTGATLVEDTVSGESLVKKHGASEEHLRNEFEANQVYRALGVNVPDH